MFGQLGRVLGNSAAVKVFEGSTNLLMEPNINGDLTHNTSIPFDLTLEILHDLGW